MGLKTSNSVHMHSHTVMYVCVYAPNVHSHTSNTQPFHFMCTVEFRFLNSTAIAHFDDSVPVKNTRDGHDACMCVFMGPLNIHTQVFV